jgi:hypothetical protein
VSDRGAGPAAATEDGGAGAATQAPAAPASDTAGARTWVAFVDRLPAPLTAFGAVVAVGGTQGGYFPNMWGPSAVALLALVAVWLVASARTDAGLADLALVGLLVLLCGWIAASIAWSAAPAQSVLEVERIFVPIAGVSAVLVLARRPATPDLGLALALGATVLSGYGLATRLLPAELGGTFDPIAGYRLSEPVGYWNGLGILAALGIVLALGTAADAGSAWRRVVSSGSLVVLAPTLYFTFSRGAWIALAVGVVGMLLVSPRRLATIAAITLLAPAPALAVVAAWRSSALTRVDAHLDDAVSDGRRLLLVLVALGALAVASALLLDVLSRRLRAGRRLRLSAGAALAAGVAVVCIAAFAHWGAPWTIADEAVHGFEKPPAAGGSTSLNERLFDFSGSGRIDLWRVALSTAESRPVLGVGAGVFERYWQKDDRWSFKARDAHNLYLETLAEVGPIGLALLVAALGVALAACVATRREPLVATGFGALLAYAVHAGVDWDWELPGITLAALTAGTIGLVARRRRDARRLPLPLRATAGVVIAAMAGLATLGFLGNDALDRAQFALDASNPSAALDESRLAHRFAPWSPYPLTVKGEALLALGREGDAREAFRSAVDVDSGYWRAWLGLGVASSGKARTAAIREAKRLYPHSVEIVETEKLLREQKR